MNMSEILLNLLQMLTILTFPCLSPQIRGLSEAIIGTALYNFKKVLYLFRPLNVKNANENFLFSLKYT